MNQHNNNKNNDNRRNQWTNGNSLKLKLSENENENFKRCADTTDCDSEAAFQMSKKGKSFFSRLDENF